MTVGFPSGRLPSRQVPEWRLDGAAVAPDLARAVSSIVVRQALGAPAVAELALADLPGRLPASLKLGAALALTLRSGEALFDGEITGLEQEGDGAGGRVLLVRAYDRLHRLRKRQRTRALPDASLAGLIAEAAADLGVAAGSSPDAPSRPLLIQHDQSDLELITELAADAGLYVRLQDGVLDACSLAGTDAPPLPMALGDRLLAFRVRTSAETLRRSVRALAWDPITLVNLDATAGLARQDEDELRDAGLSAFASLGEPGLGERVLVNRLSASHAEAAGLAQADMDRAAAGQVVLEATVHGDPAIRPGRAVAVTGVSDEIDGHFVVTTALHRFDATGGYLVEISTAAPRRPGRVQTPSAATAVSLGRITDVADPEQLGRARVGLASYGGVESGWMPVLVMGAGSGKGAIVLPETGDAALVLFPDGDPSRGVILGGFYGAGDLDAGLASDGAPRGYTLRTKDGQRLTLRGGDAATGVLARLETGAGDVMEFGTHGARFTAKQDLVIEAPGRTLTLRAAAIEFEKA